MNDNIIAEKKKYRSEIRAAMRALDKDYIEESNRGIFENLTSLPEFKAAKVLFAFYSVGEEPDTHRIIEHALETGKTVVLPRCYGKGIMDTAIIKSLAEMVEGAYNIPAPPASATALSPDKIDFALIPALAFDKNGFRLGQGGGYYDRFLENASFFAAGIVRTRFFLDKVPVEGHDAKLHCIITEKEIARL